MVIDYKQWYDNNCVKFDEIRGIVVNELERILELEGFRKKKQVILVDSRVKKYNSFIEKMLKEENGKRKYSDPTQITDMAGIRVIATLLDEVKMISDIIEKNFNVDYSNSLKASDRLKENEVGYRSTNYVAKFDIAKIERSNIPQNHRFEEYMDIPFEIQVATILDFAWQEIEHDRVYKTSAEFPKENKIRKKFLLLSALLELADYDFQALSEEVTKYEKDIMDMIRNGKLEDLDVNPSSLRLYMQRYNDVPGIVPYFIVSQNVLDELRALDILKISDLDRIIPEDFKEKLVMVSKPKDYVSYTAILRDIMIIHNPQEYFEKAYQPEYYKRFDYHAYKVHEKFGVAFSCFPEGVNYDEGSD